MNVDSPVGELVGDSVGVVGVDGAVVVGSSVPVVEDDVGFVDGEVVLKAPVKAGRN